MGDIITSVSERSRPNVPYGIGGMRSPWGGVGGYGGGAGFGMGSPSSPFRKAARFPGLPPVSDPTLAGLSNAGPNGEVYDPEKFFDVRGRDNPSVDRYKQMATARMGYMNRPGAQPGLGQGAGFGDTIDGALRRLLQARMGGGL